MAVCYIVGAGDFYGQITPQSEDIIIAADGGYDSLISHGARPDLLIGDFDSLKSVPAGIEIIRFPERKDYTDSFLAYKEGVKRGFTEFRLYGCTGGREDHTYANYSLLLYARKAGHKAVIYGNGGISFVISNEEVRLTGNKDEYISVFAISSQAKGVNITGAKYVAKDAVLTPDFPLGVSNAFENTPVNISVKQGELLIIANTEKLPEFV